MHEVYSVQYNLQYLDSVMHILIALKQDRHRYRVPCQNLYLFSEADEQDEVDVYGEPANKPSSSKGDLDSRALDLGYTVVVCREFFAIHIL